MQDLSDKWDYVLDVAAIRLANNKTERHIYNDGSYEVKGAAGELAALRYYGLDETLNEGFDGGWDFELYKGSRWERLVNVKATDWDERHLYLLWPKDCYFCCDIAMSAKVDIPQQKVLLMGWLPAGAVARSPIVEVSEKRSQACHEVLMRRLLSMKLLLDPRNLPSVFQKDPRCPKQIHRPTTETILALSKAQTYRRP